MSARSFIAENRELAFRTWRECGQNIELTIRTLKDRDGLPVTKPTIYSWIEKFNWKERAARAETEEQKAGDIQISFEEKMLADLMLQKEKYERYFASLPDASPDNQATYAYTALVRLITDIQKKAGDQTAKARKKNVADTARGARVVGLTDKKAAEIRKKILGVE
jgi:hypothetical protein